MAVGVCASREGDSVACTYRGHGVVLAMGCALDRSFAEILGRAGGLCGGIGGSMHLADLSLGVIGSNAIVGGHLPIVVGAALAAQYLGTGAVSVAFFGDGATNIGGFHESCNLASIWKLPVVFVLENNHYGEYSPLATTTPLERLAGEPLVTPCRAFTWTATTWRRCARSRVRPSHSLGGTRTDPDRSRHVSTGRALAPTQRATDPRESSKSRSSVTRSCASLRACATRGWPANKISPSWANGR